MFSLGTWSSQLQSGFLVSRPTRHTSLSWINPEHTPINLRFALLGIRGFHALWLSFQRILLAQRISNLRHVSGSTCFLLLGLDKSRSYKRSFIVSQPLSNIRLPTYSNCCQLENLKGLGWYRFARHYSGNRCLLSLPQGTKMFQFPWFPLPTLYIQVRVIGHDSNRVSPFGHPRFKGC